MDGAFLAVALKGVLGPIAVALIFGTAWCIGWLFWRFLPASSVKRKLMTHLPSNTAFLGLLLGPLAALYLALAIFDH